MFPKKPRVAFTVLEWISHSKVESKITTEFGMYNREMFFPVTEHRIDSFHAAVKTQDKEVQIQPQAQPVGHCYLLIEFVEFKFAARLIFVITQMLPASTKTAPLNFQKRRVRYSTLASNLTSPD